MNTTTANNHKRFAKKQTITDVDAKPSQAEAQTTPEAEAKPTFEQLYSKVWSSAEELLAAIGYEAPSWKRYVCATLLVTLVTIPVGIAVGQLINFALAAMMTMPFAFVLQVLVLTFGLMLSAYVGLKIGEHVGKYVLSGQIDADIKSCWLRTKSLFTRNKPAPVAAA